jgi:signal transduction histidine kinase
MNDEAQTLALRSPRESIEFRVGDPYLGHPTPRGAKPRSIDSHTNPQVDATLGQDERLATVAHDLRNMVTTLYGNIWLLAKYAVEQDTKTQAVIDERMAAITRAVHQIEAQIVQLEHWSMYIPTSHPVDLVALARHCVAAHFVPDKVIRVEVDAGVSQVIGNWDEVGLTSALDNLISNAIKYTSAGGSITIQVGTEQHREDTTAVVRVCDRGVGIPAEELSKIFEPHYRASNVMPAVTGKGLGLASVQHVVATAGGSVSVASQLGVGSCFTIRLPLAPAI